MTDEEIIAVVTAHKEGKKIEFSLLGEEYWTLTTFPQWDFSRYNYRVKSEPHYRPFKNAEEVMEAIKEHGSWIKWKDGSGFNLIVCVAYSVLWLGTAVESMYFKEAFKNMTFYDGTPFGKLEE